MKKCYGMPEAQGIWLEIEPTGQRSYERGIEMIIYDQGEKDL